MTMPYHCVVRSDVAHNNMRPKSIKPGGIIIFFLRRFISNTYHSTALCWDISHISLSTLNGCNVALVWGYAFDLWTTHGVSPPDLTSPLQPPMTEPFNQTLLALHHNVITWPIPADMQCGRQMTQVIPAWYVGKIHWKSIPYTTPFMHAAGEIQLKFLQLWT